MTPSNEWDNEWTEIAGPEDILIGVVQNPKLLPLQGKRLAEVAKMQNKDPMDALFDLLIEDNAFTEVAVFGMSEPDVALALQQPWVAFDNDSSGTSPEGFWARSILTRAPTAPSRASCASMFVKKRNSRWKMPSANSPRCRRSACA